MASLYKVYENNDGAVLEQVETICRHLTDNGSFGGQSTLNVTELERFIQDTYYEMAGWLAEFGYATEQTNEVILGILEGYNALGAAARAELSLATTGFGPNENTRFNFLWKQYRDGLRLLLAGEAFGALGAASIADARGDGLTAGGISVSDKRTIETDSDATKYSFTRKRHDNPSYDSQHVTEIATYTPELP